MIVIIDNDDSFIFNIARYFRKLGQATQAIRNDRISIDDLVDLRPSAPVISLGPCTPVEAGRSTTFVHDLSGPVPMLGICLGHQCIGSSFGGRVARAVRLMHRRSSHVTHDGRGVFEGLPSPICVGRYHSLVIELAQSCDQHLKVAVRWQESEIMGAVPSLSANLWSAVSSGIDTYPARACVSSTLVGRQVTSHTGLLASSVSNPEELINRRPSCKANGIHQPYLFWQDDRNTTLYVSIMQDLESMLWRP
ncbi:anthranilate synthase/aminodeoxychorismate synthase-like glutamine amidotransferase [Bradyrhizobium sp. cir1]|nr:anthranilate synthase/aminodeoxychorismate synthase-like glutamine amidotransferase [Bradyrhizobium sp. cir1]